MSNIIKPRDAKRFEPDSELSDDVAADTKLILGALYGLDASGYAVNMESGVTARARGVVVETADNTDGDAGDIKVRGLAGTYLFHVLSGDEPTIADKTELVYAYDNHTVARTSNSGARPVAGRLMGLLSDGRAIVHVGADVRDGSDLGDQFQISFEKVSSKAADAEVARIVIGAPCVIEKFYTVLNGALATANATVQAKKNGSNIGSTTTGLATITESGSAAGDVDSATPLTTNLDLDAGDILSFTVGGGSTATETLNITAVLRSVG